MARSSPALKLAAQSVGVHPVTCPWPFQSPTTTPVNPMRPRNSPVSSGLLPCILVPLIELKLAMIVSTPAAIARR